MISWKVGIEKEFKLSVGKNYKFIQYYLSEENWQDFLLTFDLSTKEKMEQSFWHTLSLFQTYSKQVSLELGFDYPNDDEVMISFIETFYLKR